MLPHGIGNVCAAVTGDGGRDGREGPSKHGPGGDISRFCAVLIMDHEATQTPPIGRCHTATLPNMQPSPLCRYQPTVQFYKAMSPHQRQQCHPQSIHHNQHITLMSTKHSLCSSWVRCYIMPCCASFRTSPGVFFPSSCSKQLTLPPPCNSQDLHIYR